MGEKKFICCLCGKECTGWGNNPWPLSLNDEDRCCDECNNTKVIIARLSGIARMRTDDTTPDTTVS